MGEKKSKQQRLRGDNVWLTHVFRSQFDSLSSNFMISVSIEFLKFYGVLPQ
jgi:hypothetical protein